MFKRIAALAVCAIAIAACSGTPTTETPGPGGTETPGAGATETPGATQGGQTNPPAGDLEALARALVPPGSTETQKVEIGGFFQLYITSTMSLAELEAFWDSKIPSLGMTLAGKFTGSGSLTISITNPDGGIVATEDTSAGNVGIVIALGTSS